MIQLLISKTVAELKSELARQINKSQITAVPISKTLDENLPQIAVYPGKLTIDRQFENNISVNGNLVQEFQQILLIDICTKDLERLEKLTSLVTGIILINQEKLIQDYNNPTENNNSQKDATYTSKTISTIHKIGKINLLEGIYTALETPFTFQLKYEVFGRLTIAKTTKEDRSRIEEIELQQVKLSANDNSTPKK